MADHMLLGTRKGVFTLRRSGSTWDVENVALHGIPVPYADLDPRTGTLWATVDHGHWGHKLHRSDDRGATWPETAAPKYPEGAEIKPDVPASCRYLWVFAPGHASQPGRLYIGTEPGGLFVSDDDGETWSLNEPLWNVPERPEHWFGGGRDHAGIHSVVVDPRDADHIFIGISCAGVYETTDGGASWTIRNEGLRADYLPDPNAKVGQDPHLVVACEANPDAMWQQHHCGIWRTTDGARSWQEVTEADGPARFGFAVAVHETNADRAWVVPAISDEVRIAVDGALCVSRTDDGGATWTAFRNGLPQAHAYDITFRHALANAGDTLAFGTTTGNLYVSDDAGETWSAAAHNLPPIYSVRMF